MHQEVLRVRVATLGPEHPVVAVTKVRLKMSGYTNFQHAFIRTMMYMRGLGFVQMNIGSVLYAQKKLTQARQMYEEAVAIQEKTLGLENADTASSMMGVALVMEEMGQLDAAIEKYGQVVRIQEATLGHNHPVVADTQVPQI